MFVQGHVKMAEINLNKKGVTVEILVCHFVIIISLKN